MSCSPEPFVARHDRPDRLIRLADVLITTSDGRPRHAQFTSLFSAYPGLTLILLLGADRTVEIGARDGTTASLRLDPSTSIGFAAVALYHGWVGQLSADDPRPR